MAADKKVLFPTYDSLNVVVREVNEARANLNSASLSGYEKPFSPIAGGVAGGIVGGAAAPFVISFAGFNGFNAAGIVSGFATVGSLVGQGMLVGSFLSILGPVAVVGGTAAGVIHHHNKKKLAAQKASLLSEISATRRDIQAVLRGSLRETPGTSQLRYWDRVLERREGELKSDLNR